MPCQVHLTLHHPFLLLMMIRHSCVEPIHLYDACVMYAACSPQTTIYNGSIVIRTGKPRPQDGPDWPVTLTLCQLWRLPAAVATSDLCVQVHCRIPNVSGSDTDDVIGTFLQSDEGQAFAQHLGQGATPIFESFKLVNPGIFHVG